MSDMSSGQDPSAGGPPPPPGGYQTPPPQGQWATPAPYGQGIYAVGEQREPVTVLLLSLVTCGIYGIYVLYQMSMEFRNALNREDINPQTDLILTIVTCGIWGIYLVYRNAKLTLEMQQRVGLPENDISTVAIILSVVGLYVVALFMLQGEMNKVWAQAGGAPAA